MRKKEKKNDLTHIHDMNGLKKEEKKKKNLHAMEFELVMDLVQRLEPVMDLG
jgi:hypothetical protein